MRVAYLSHSLVAPRQALFASALRRKLGDGDLLEIYPADWGQHHRDGGYPVTHPGDQLRYGLHPAAWRRVRDHKPDLVLLQQEPYCLTSQITRRWCKRTKTPYVVFTWENLNLFSRDAAEVLSEAALVVCGNQDARKLVQDAVPGAKTKILPQIGIEPTLFAPMPVPKEYDVLFMGRARTPMKGERILDEATASTKWKVAKGHALGYAAYEALPERYSRARVQCTPSRDLEADSHPREQFAPACSVEGLMCGVPVVTTNQAAVREWLGDCPAAWFAQQGDAADLREKLRSALQDTKEHAYQQKADAGRQWALERFSNDAVAAKYAAAFREVLA